MIKPLEVRRIGVHQTTFLLMEVHYARRMPSIQHAFGLYIEGRLEGVVTYGVPFSSTLRRGVCGPDYESKVLELNRLCLYGNEKGHASLLVGRSLRMLEGDAVVVSFADTAQGHVGTVYQATNFVYCGLSAKRTDWKVKGQEHLHGQTISDQFRGVPNRGAAVREKYGADFYLAPRPQKHRYVYVVGSRRFRREAMTALRYPVQPYPKREGETK